MIDLVNYTNKIGEDEWEANIKVTGDQKSVSAISKMLSTLTYLMRANPPVVEIDVEEKPLSTGEKFG